MRKLWYVLLAMVIVGMLVLPAIAAPGATTSSTTDKNKKPDQKPDPTTQILTIVTAIQTNVNKLLTGLTTLQTDVTTLKTGVTTLQTNVATLQTTADEINSKVSGSGGSGSSQEPSSYEYYITLSLPTLNSAPYSIPETILANAGDSSCQACITDWDQKTTPWTVLLDECYTVDPKTTTKVHTVSGRYQRTIKITTDSKYLVPTMHLVGMDDDNNLLYEQYFNPGDFQKVEIYS